MALTRRIVVATLVLQFLVARGPAFAQQQAAPPIPDTRSEPQGFLIEPEVVRGAAIFADRHLSNGEMGEGLFIDVKNMIPGAGWLLGGPGYRRWYDDDHVLAEASGVISWRAYKTLQGRVELPMLLKSRLAVGSQMRWQDYTQVNFFGAGPATLESDRSEYRLRSTNLVGYATVRPAKNLGITGTLGVLWPSVLPRSGSFLRNRADTRQRFPGDPVFAIDEQPAFFHSEVSVAADTRDFPGHPTRGVLLRAAASRYSDRETGLFSFRRYEGEAAHFLPLADSRVVIATHGWLAASDTDEGRFVPFYLQPSLGGANTLRAYPDFRFHDRHLLTLSVEGRVAMLTHVDAALVFDAGNVASRMSDLDLGKRSYGIGLRLHTRRQTVARIDLAHGGDGWRLMFNLGDPLTLSRASRRTAAAPFVP